MPVSLAPPAGYFREPSDGPHLATPPLKSKRFSRDPSSPQLPGFLILVVRTNTFLILVVRTKTNYTKIILLLLQLDFSFLLVATET